jgi:hypothetical protein
MGSAFPQFLTPALLSLFAAVDSAAPLQPAEGGFFITQSEIADMDAAGVDEELKTAPGHNQRESEASLLPWLPPSIIPAQAPQALDPAVQAETGADAAACEPAPTPSPGVPVAGADDLPMPVTPLARVAPEQSARHYESLPIDRRCSAGPEEDVITEPGVHESARPSETVSRAGQFARSDEVRADGLTSSTGAEQDAARRVGEERRPQFTNADLKPESTAGRNAFAEGPASQPDAYARLKVEMGQRTSKGVEQRPAISIGRAVTTPSRRSSRPQDTNEPADGVPFEAEPPVDTLAAATAPSLTGVDSGQTAPAVASRPDAIGPRATASSPASDSAENRSTGGNMAGDRQDGAAPASHTAGSSRSEAAEPRIFAFGMRLTPSEGKAQASAAQPTESSPGTPEHEPVSQAHQAPRAEDAEHKPALKRDLATESKSEPFSSSQASTASNGDAHSAPAQVAGWAEEGAGAIGIQERTAPEVRRGEAPDSGTQAPLTTHRAIHLQSKDVDAQASTGPLREIKLELGGGGERVSVKLSERQGHVDLTVHSRDAALAGELRRDLPSLTAQIEQAGFRTEATRAGSNLAGDAKDGERWSEARDGAAGQGGGRQHRHQNPDERKKEFKWLFPTLGE